MCLVDKHRQGFMYEYTVNYGFTFIVLAGFYRSSAHLKEQHSKVKTLRKRASGRRRRRVELGRSVQAKIEIEREISREIGEEKKRDREKKIIRIKRIINREI